MKKLCMLLAALILIPVASKVARCEIALNFGLYTSDRPSELKLQFRPVIEALESKMSEILGEAVTIRFKFSKSYEDGIRDLITGEVDFSRFGPASYVQTKKRNPGIQILAVESVEGKKSFNGVICVAGDSPIRNLADLRGKSFAFGNRLSTIGRYLSQQYLRIHGIRAGDLSEYAYLDTHNDVGIAVAKGRFVAGALKESSFKKLVKKGTGLKALATFPNMTKPWIAKAGLSDRVRKALTASLLAMKDPEALAVLKKDGFLSGTDADFDVIRSAIEGNGLFFR